MNQDLYSAITTVLAFLGGAAITWRVSHVYYVKAGLQLEQEAKNLRKQSEMILRWLEVRGEQISIVRDEDGHPVGLARYVQPSEEVVISPTIVGFVHEVPEEPQS